MGDRERMRQFFPDTGNEERGDGAAPREAGRESSQFCQDRGGTIETFLLM